MNAEPSSVVDPQLRANGVEGLGCRHLDHARSVQRVYLCTDDHDRGEGAALIAEDGSVASRTAQSHPVEHRSMLEGRDPYLKFQFARFLSSCGDFGGIIGLHVVELIG